MKNDRVIVFVDAYPFEEKHKLKHTSQIYKSINPMQPSFGYSINVKSMLFAKLNPDEVGFLNEWTFDYKNGYSLIIPYFIDRIIRFNRFVKRATAKILSKLFSVNFRDIPLSLLSSMKEIGITAYEDKYDRPTIFSENNIKRYVYTNHNGDSGAFNKLCEDLKNNPAPQRCFLAMAELDHIMHKYGMKTKEYYDEINNVDEKLNHLWKLLNDRGNNPELLLISDHGMTPVSEGINFNIEKFVPGFQKDYFYFVDATMVRVWILNNKRINDINEWFKNSELPGTILNDEEKKRWGITSKKFGDIIFLLDDGKMFIPNFIGDLGCKAMHGYLPTHKTQLGIIASTKKINHNDTILAENVYEELEKFIN